MDNLKKERELVWVQILYLYIIPVLLLYFKIIPNEFRVILLFGIAILLYGIVKHNKWSYSDLGIKKDLKEDLAPYTVFTVGGVLFLLWLSQIVPHEPFLGWWKNIRFLLLFIPISVLQEIVFRGILMDMLNKVFKSPVFIIVINAGIFALMHVIYLNSIFVLPMTFMAGIGFAWIYFKYKNLILISISHTILNFVAMVMGFFIIR